MQALETPVEQGAASRPSGCGSGSRQGLSNPLQPAVRRRSPVFAARVFDRCCRFDSGVNPKNRVQSGDFLRPLYKASRVSPGAHDLSDRVDGAERPTLTRMAHAVNGREGGAPPMLLMPG